MLKKIALASVATLILAGCASTNKAAEPTPAPVVTVTEQAPPATDTYSSSEDTFLADVHNMNNAYIENTTDSNLLDIGTATCAALGEGNTIEDIITYLATNGTFSSADEAEAGGMVIAAAVVDLCPQYTNQLQSYINS